MRLGTVLDQLEFVTAREVKQWIKVRRLAVKMGRKQNTRSGRDRSFDPGWIEVVRERVGLDQDRDSSGRAYR